MPTKQDIPNALTAARLKEIQRRLEAIDRSYRIQDPTAKPKRVLAAEQVIRLWEKQYEERNARSRRAWDAKVNAFRSHVLIAQKPFAALLRELEALEARYRELTA